MHSLQYQVQQGFQLATVMDQEKWIEHKISSDDQLLQCPDKYWP